MEIFVKKAEPEDAAAIARLSDQMGYTISVRETLRNLEIISQHENEIIFVALNDKKLLGWIHVFHTTRLESGSFCEIGGLVVDDQFRHQGIGTLLIDKIKPWCINRGSSNLRVRSNVKRKDAHEFYLRMGFDESKQQKVFGLTIPMENP
jgi:GNAT superfamily N-acetyltransferase